MHYSQTTRLLPMLTIVFMLGACAAKAPASQPEPAPEASSSAATIQTAAQTKQASPAATSTVKKSTAKDDDVPGCDECLAKDNAECYKLQPGKVTKTKKGKKTIVSTGRCQPQSLIYARCRSGITTCRMGDTSPVQWFACARKNHATTSLPRSGAVMVLDGNKGRGMPTGHPAFVEEAKRNADGTWTLRISHTNYDRKCHLDKDTKITFYPDSMEATFLTGPWSSWAKKLKVCGFIVR